MKQELPLAAQGIKGLTSSEVLVSRDKNGTNLLDFKKENSILSVLKRLAQDPMVIILLVASIIYFISNKTADAIFLASAILFQIGISFFQDARSTNALEKLKEFIVAKSKVIRNGKVEEIKSENLVLGDVIIIEEGMAIPADAIIIHSNDFLVNESILTGESLSVEKNLVNRSFYYSIITTLRHKNNLVLLIIAITLGITSLILYVKSLSKFFEFESLSFYQLSFCLIVGSLSVIWYEGVKLLKRRTSKNLN